MFVDDGVASSAFDETMQDPVDVGAGHAAGEFAVAEAAGASFAEEVIIFLMEFAAAVEVTDFGDAFFYGVTSFKDDGAVAFVGEVVTGEQSCRTGPDDDGAMVGGGLSGGWVFERFRREVGDMGVPFQFFADFLGVGQVDGNGVDEFELVAGTSVEAFAEDVPVWEGICFGFQAARDGVTESLFRLFNGDADIDDTDGHKVDYNEKQNEKTGFLGERAG